MLINVHALMQDTNYVDFTSISKPVKQNMRTGSAFEVTGADGFGAPALPPTGGKIRADAYDFSHIEIGLVFPPVVRGVVPDFAQIFAGTG
jgi:hypothetical protein